MTSEEKEVHANKYKRGDNYWISKGINPIDKQKWIDDNWSGRNHSHKKCYPTDEEYQEFLNSKLRGENFWLNRCITDEERDRYIKDNYVGKNNPIFRNKTEDELEVWLNKYRRGENHPNAKYIYEFEINGEVIITKCLRSFCNENNYNLHVLLKIIERDSGIRDSYTPREKKYHNWKGKRVRNISDNNGARMDKIKEQLEESGYDYAIAIATQAEIEAGAACGQLSIIIQQQDSDNSDE